MKLIYSATRKPVHVGDEIQYVHHNAPAGTAPKTLIVTHIEKPKHGGSTGRVYAGEQGVNRSPGYYPSVYDMEWIEREDQAEEDRAFTLQDGFGSFTVNVPR
jgi:hypothetical protein